MVKDVALYVLAAFFEIFGCYVFWVVLKGGKQPLYIVAGIISLVVFAWILTRVEGDFAGRAYAAYGGIYIIASLLWLIGVERESLTRFDIIGASISLFGALIIITGGIRA
ncbi:MAG: YnfA family protein [Wolinella sp.]